MPSAKSSATLELLVPLDRDSPEPLHRQLEAYLRTAVRERRLAAGATMPSSRALAAQLGVARGVVVEAYEQLVAEGYLLSRAGGSTRVANVPGLPAREETPPRDPVAAIDLRPGRPDMAEFPRAMWSRSARRVLNEAPNDRFTYLGGSGVPELRSALAEYLARARGVATHADDIVISTGFMQALRIVARTLARLGARRVGMEDPYDDTAYGAGLADSGLEVVPIEVDEDGLRVDRAVQADLDAIVVTPAHQFPTGAVLSPERRTALLAWARARDAIIVEDDYDAEFRYDREPVGAMQGLDPDHVVYAGTASKSIAPGLRLGWLAAPPRLAGHLTDTKFGLDHGSAALDQLILADVIARGDLDRHLRHMRSIYRRRRAVLLEALATELPTWRVVGASAGLHLLALLPLGCDEGQLVAAAREAGVIINGLSGYGRRPERRAGVVFGYGLSDERALRSAVAILASLEVAHGHDPPSPRRSSLR